MWLLECQRVSREVQRIEPSLERMRKVSAASHSSAVESREEQSESDPMRIRT